MEAGLDGRMVGVSSGAAFLLCRRASRLSSHSAQWALPGGRLDPGGTAVDAACGRPPRRWAELAPGDGSRLLDDHPTRSGYVITPVVVDLGRRPAHAASRPRRGGRGHRVGLHQLQRDDSPRFITIPESPPGGPDPVGQRSDPRRRAPCRCSCAGWAWRAGPIRSMNSNSRCSPGDDRGRAPLLKPSSKARSGTSSRTRGSGTPLRRGNGSAVTAAPLPPAEPGGAVIRRPPDLDAAVDDEVIVPGHLPTARPGPTSSSRIPLSHRRSPGPWAARWFPHRGRGVASGFGVSPCGGPGSAPKGPEVWMMASIRGQRRRSREQGMQDAADHGLRDGDQGGLFAAGQAARRWRRGRIALGVSNFPQPNGGRVVVWCHRDPRRRCTCCVSRGRRTADGRPRDVGLDRRGGRTCAPRLHLHGDPRPSASNA